MPYFPLTFIVTPHFLQELIKTTDTSILIDVGMPVLHRGEGEYS